MCRPPAARAPAQARCCSDSRSRGPFTSDSLASRLSAFHSSRSGMPPAEPTVQTSGIQHSYEHGLKFSNHRGGFTKSCSPAPTISM